MPLPEGYQQHYDAEARLVILKALAEQADYTLPENILVMTLQTFGFNRGREYVRNQLNWMKDTAGAVKLRTPGAAVIATITEAGLDHVQGRRVLDSIKRPSPPEA